MKGTTSVKTSNVSGGAAGSATGVPRKFRSPVNVTHKLLNGYDIFRRDPLLLFTAELSGGGTARLDFLGVPGSVPGREFGYLRTRYEFEPVPEPATFTLIALAGAAAALRKTRRARSQ